MENELTFEQAFALGMFFSAEMHKRAVWELVIFAPKGLVGIAELQKECFEALKDRAERDDFPFFPEGVPDEVWDQAFFVWQALIADKINLFA